MTEYFSQTTWVQFQGVRGILGFVTEPRIHLASVTETGIHLGAVGPIHFGLVGPILLGPVGPCWCH